MSEVPAWPIRGFLGSRPLERVSAELIREQNARAAVFGVPFDGASLARTGSSVGPQAIRAAATVGPYFHDLGGVHVVKDLKLVDCGDCVVVPGNVKATIDMGAAVVAEILRGGAMPVIFGGEHTVTACGTLAVDQALAGSFGFIHLDAHLDAQKEGIPWFHGSQVARTAELAAFPGEKMVLIGSRGGVNPPDHFEFLEEVGATCITMREVVKSGLSSAITRAIEIATDGTDGFYLSVDMDVLEAAYVPGAEAFTPFGVTVRELWPELEVLGRNPGLVGFDVVEVVPTYDTSGLTAMTAAAIAAELLAHRAGVLDQLRPLDLKPHG